MSKKTTLYMETTKIPAERSVAEVASELIKAGATQIATDYSQGKVVGLRWTMRVNGADALFEMPARVFPIYRVLRERKGFRLIEYTPDFVPSDKLTWQKSRARGVASTPSVGPGSKRHDRNRHGPTVGSFHGLLDSGRSKPHAVPELDGKSVQGPARARGLMMTLEQQMDRYNPANLCERCRLSPRSITHDPDTGIITYYSGCGRVWTGKAEDRQRESESPKTPAGGNA